MFNLRVLYEQDPRPEDQKPNFVKDRLPHISEFCLKLRSALVQIEGATEEIKKIPFWVCIGGSSPWQYINAHVHQKKVMQKTDTDTYAVLYNAFKEIIGNYKEPLKSTLKKEFDVDKVYTGGAGNVDFFSVKKNGHDYNLVEFIEVFFNFQVFIDEQCNTQYAPDIPTHKADFQRFIFQHEIICYTEKLNPLIAQARYFAERMKQAKALGKWDEAFHKAELITAEGIAFQKMTFILKSLVKPLQANKKLNPETALFFDEMFNDPANEVMFAEIADRAQRCYPDTFDPHWDASLHIQKLKTHAENIVAAHFGEPARVRKAREQDAYQQNVVMGYQKEVLKLKSEKKEFQKRADSLSHRLTALDLKQAEKDKQLEQYKSDMDSSKAKLDKQALQIAEKDKQLIEQKALTKQYQTDSIEDKEKHLEMQDVLEKKVSKLSDRNAYLESENEKVMGLLRASYIKKEADELSNQQAIKKHEAKSVCLEKELVASKEKTQDLEAKLAEALAALSALKEKEKSDIQPPIMEASKEAEATVEEDSDSDDEAGPSQATSSTKKKKKKKKNKHKNKNVTPEVSEGKKIENDASWIMIKEFINADVKPVVLENDEDFMRYLDIHFAHHDSEYYELMFTQIQRMLRQFKENGETYHYSTDGSFAFVCSLYLKSDLDENIAAFDILAKRVAEFFKIKDVRKYMDEVRLDRFLKLLEIVSRKLNLKSKEAKQISENIEEMIMIYKVVHHYLYSGEGVEGLSYCPLQSEGGTLRNTANKSDITLNEVQSAQILFAFWLFQATGKFDENYMDKLHGTVIKELIKVKDEKTKRFYRS